jgi:DNA-binding transcriptional LysR family regulator
MNIHHLELFYYVARHGGITEAVRNIPYGIQQPAVSGQVAQLEAFLGVTLFQRRPFKLTADGQKLYDFIQPFFSSLDRIASELQGAGVGQVRIGASGIVLREHLPELFALVRKKFPALKVILREGYQAELEAMLQREELDLAVTVLEKKSPATIQSKPLIELPLVLLVPKNSPYQSAEQLWAKDKIDDALICLPGHETISKHFQQGLLRLGVDWFPTMEVSSLDLIEAYVTAGFGIGLSVKVPKTEIPPGLRVLQLPGFDKVLVGALWRGRITPLVQVFLNEMQAKAKRLS